MLENKLTSEEIAKVFSSYYPCKVMKHKSWAKEAKPKEFNNVHQNTGWYMQLKMLDSISDEDAIEILHTEYPNVTNGFEALKIQRNRHCRVVINFRYKHPDNRRNLDDGFSYSSWENNFGTMDADLFQYLISKGYAVPLWFGINHWANSKNAIELGIAISK